MALQQNSDAGQKYKMLIDLFNHAKKFYSPTEPFLNARALGFVDSKDLEIIRKANLATFMMSVLGSQDVGFYQLNEYFFDAFIAEGHQLLKVHGEILLELKTQAYVSAVSNGEQPRENVLSVLFPDDLEKRLLQRRPGATQAQPNEKEFLQRAGNRKKTLLEGSDTQEAIKALSENYLWANFLKEVSTYMSKNFQNITGEPVSLSIFIEVFWTCSQSNRVKQARKPGRPSKPTENLKMQPPSNEISAPAEDIASKAARATEYALQDYRSKKTSNGSNPILQAPQDNSLDNGFSPRPPGPDIQFHYENELHPNVPGPQVPYFNTDANGQPAWNDNASDPNYVPFPTQSAPTSVLFERARMAASSKSSPSVQKPGLPSQRRPWTLEEEHALMAGLDRVKGPRWSQILAMFGRGGTISEILKDRGQVQLKDKARNLKLFFLKNGNEVPYYLQYVTGELKTRAPGAAAKKEAQERKLSDEDRAHVEGVMALATGPQQRGNASTAHNGVTNGENKEHNLDTSNVDPSLSTMQRNPLNPANTYTADFTAPIGPAPNADMTTGRPQS